MAKFQLDFDVQRFRKGLIRLGKGYHAVKETVRVSGYGETINSRRKKNEWDNRKPVHGRVISWYFRTHFRVDAFEMSGPEFHEILADMVKTCEEAIDEAYRKERPQHEKIRRALTLAAQSWAIEVQDRIEAGRLGVNTKDRKAKKEALVKAGVFPSRYGQRPPKGIGSGRWVEGIRGRWKLGRVADADTFELR